MVYNATDSPDLSGVTDMSGMFSLRRRLQRRPLLMGRLICHRHVQHVPWRHLLQPAPQRLGRLMAVRDMSRHVHSRHRLQPAPQHLERLLCHLHEPACSMTPPPSTSPSTTGTSHLSPTWSPCSQAPPPSTTPSTPGTSPLSPTCTPCYQAPPPSTSPSTTGMSLQSGTWDVSLLPPLMVTSQAGMSPLSHMPFMFYGATSFDQPLNDWDVSSVSEMGSMFYGATSFNQPLNDWDVSSVTYMNDMFYGATSFDQPLNAWDVSS